MATARAVYHWAEDASLAVAIEVEGSFPDAVSEAAVNCRRLMRDCATDLAVEIAAIEDEADAAD